MATTGVEENSGNPLRLAYERQVEDLRLAFNATGDGTAFCRGRAEAADALLRGLWEHEAAALPDATRGVALVALGGYGRGGLFPFSDIDLLFCTEKGSISDRCKDAIRRVSQAAWDCGLKFAGTARAVADCERFKAADPESSLALLDLRFVAGDAVVGAALHTRILERRTVREARNLGAALATLTQGRHSRFGNTLFHLEPNVKDAPGGLRDAHACAWLASLRGGERAATTDTTPFREAVEFLIATRVFLHLRHRRDDNTLDWHAQDEAAAAGIGLGWFTSEPRSAPDAAYWMRAYFRHARAVERELAREAERSGTRPKPPKSVLRVKAPPRSGFFVIDGVLELKLPDPALDPAHDSEIVLGAFGLMAETGVELGPGSEERIAASIPALSASLEDGPRLWARLHPILAGAHAADALREMHALGVLELLVPEFHGIDALVIRDAYHRYTVDEHTFVLIDVLHGLAEEPPKDAPEWRRRFRSTLRELPHPELLFLAALLHDTGKGRASSQHAAVSAGLAAKLCARLELGPYETDLVVRLIECHLEMSAALRRDIFDSESVRAFAEKTGSHELLRMLTLFTFADISAVHPDALTPWKAENLWRLSMAAANQLDRSVDEERVHTHGSSGDDRALEAILRALARSPAERSAAEVFLDGFPERYLRTRSLDTIRQHLGMSAPAANPVLLTPRRSVLELTVVAADRSQLFADLAAVLAAWGMDVVSAEAFSNSHGTVIDTFRFTDTYRTLEMNPGEADRLRAELSAAVRTSPGSLGDRRRSPRIASRRTLETQIEFDNTASSHSTLLQVVTRDIPGLLRATALALSQFGCSVEIALVDTEGETAIDVFYVTRRGEKLGTADIDELRRLLTDAIHANAR